MNTHRDLFDDVLQRLGKAWKGKKGGDEWRGPATWRGGDGPNVTITRKPDAPGGFVWCDHVQGDSGHGVDLAKLLGIEVGDVATPRTGRRRPAKPKPATPKPAKPATPKPEPKPEPPGGWYVQTVAEWCALRGSTPAALEAYGVRVGRYQNATCLIWEVGELPTRPKRYRSLTKPGTPKEVRILRWESNAGGTSCVYGERQARALWSQRELLGETATPPVYVVNGEPAVWASYAHGVPAVCFAMGEGTLPPVEVLQSLLATFPGAPVRVVYDTDDTGRRGARSLVAALRELGRFDAVALDLTSWGGADVADVTDADDLARECKRGDRSDDVPIAGVYATALASLAALADSADTGGEQGDGAIAFEQGDGAVAFEPNDALSEDALALALEAQLQGRALYDHDAEKWYFWDGARWLKDSTARAFHMAREVCRVQSSTEDKPQGWRKASVARAVESFCKATPALSTTQDRWDSDPWQIATPGGLVNLRNGELLEANPEARCTKLAGATPSSGTPNRWRKFLHETTGGDAELVAYLQRLVGYMLTGETTEHALIFVHGAGGNGKSVFLNVVAALLGDYAVNAPSRTFAAGADNRHPEELARLAGARFVYASETVQGSRWDTERIKGLTGGDPVTARFMKVNSFTFRPRFKLVIVGNHRPALGSVDDAIRRRLHLVPFEQKPANPDRELEAKLLGELPAIMSWAIEGCAMWQRVGLAPPAAVVDATEEYLSTEDAVGEWLAECCVLKPYASAATSKLFESWREFAEARGERVGTINVLSEALKKRGFRPTRSTGGQRNVRGFEGVDLIPPPAKPDRRTGERDYADAH